MVSESSVIGDITIYSLFIINFIYLFLLLFFSCLCRKTRSLSDGLLIQKQSLCTVRIVIFNVSINNNIIGRPKLLCPDMMWMCAGCQGSVNRVYCCYSSFLSVLRSSHVDPEVDRCTAKTRNQHCFVIFHIFCLCLMHENLTLIGPSGPSCSKPD